jgi:hypothetical protein
MDALVAARQKCPLLLVRAYAWRMAAIRQVLRESPVLRR